MAQISLRLLAKARENSGGIYGRGADLDPSAKLLDVASHHVHAYSASQNAGDLGGGAEARMEDEIVDLRIREPLLGGDQPGAQSLLEDPVAVEAPPVIGDLHDHLPGLMLALSNSWAVAGLPF